MENATSAATKETQRMAKGFSTTARWWMRFVLLGVDALSLSLALGMSVALRHFVLGNMGDLTLYWKTFPLLGTFFLLSAWHGLYQGGNSPVRELRLLSECTSMTFLLLMAVTFFTQTGTHFSRFIFLIAWLLALALLPISRWGVRYGASRLGLWGEPLAILGDGEHGWQMAQLLNRQLYLGLRPVVLITAAQADFQPLPVSKTILVKRFGQPEKILRYLKERKLETLVVAPQEVPEGWLSALLDAPHSHIRRVIFLTPMDGIPGVDVRTYDLGGTVGLELHQNLLSFGGRFVKRGLDLLLGAIASLLTLPLSLAIAVWIKLDSPGPVFYRQSRIGRYGKPFSVFKFRTMVQEADRVLEKYLESNPALRLEWDATQKLKDDPRITRAGKILRRLSLDELPQLINVLRGEMSLVGPRPCMPQQIELYGHVFELYKRVRPGITGLWQVSGRNETTYAERVRLDEYYVRNWSLWLDIYIMIRTIWVVLRRDGAY